MMTDAPTPTAACTACEWVGQAEDDTCPHCRRRGTLTDYRNVAWALGFRTTDRP